MITFQTLQSSKIDTIAQMMSDFYAIDNYPIDINATKILFQEFIENENFGKCWLICHEKEIVGYVILTLIFSFEYEGKLAFLDELYIKETARGKGIGKKTIQFIKEQVSYLNVKMMYLEVESHNQNAQKLYIANDFVFHNRKIMKHKF